MAWHAVALAMTCLILVPSSAEPTFEQSLRREAVRKRFIARAQAVKQKAATKLKPIEKKTARTALNTAALVGAVYKTFEEDQLAATTAEYSKRAAEAARWAGYAAAAHNKADKMHKAQDKLEKRKESAVDMLEHKLPKLAKVESTLKTRVQAPVRRIETKDANKEKNIIERLKENAIEDTRAAIEQQVEAKWSTDARSIKKSEQLTKKAQKSQWDLDMEILDAAIRAVKLDEFNEDKKKRVDQLRAYLATKYPKYKDELLLPTRGVVG